MLKRSSQTPFFLYLVVLSGYLRGADSQLADNSDAIKKGDGVCWNLAERALRAEQGLYARIDQHELEVATEAIYADYLRYLDDIGLGLSKANLESKINEEKERFPLSDDYCTAAQLREWESYSMSALDSDLSTFVTTYCGLPCHNDAEVYTTVMDPKSCVDEASALYQAYDCHSDPSLDYSPAMFSGIIPLAAVLPWNEVSIRLPTQNASDSSEGKYPTSNEPEIVMFPNEPAGLEYTPVLTDELLPNVEDTSEEAPATPTGSLASTSGPTLLLPPRSVKEKVSRKVTQCKKAYKDDLITTYAPGDLDVDSINDHFDPAWVSTPVDPVLLPDESVVTSEVDGSHCMTVDDSSSKRKQKLDVAYQTSRDERFPFYFSQYHIWSIDVEANGGITFSLNEAIVSQIKASADVFFSAIINSYDPLLGLHPCADGAADDLGALLPPQKLDAENNGKEITLDDLTATDSPFSAFVSRFIGSYLDGLTFSDSLGTGDELHPPIWNTILKGQVSSAELTDYVNNLQTRSPAAYAEFIRFLKLNDQHIMLDLLAGAMGGFTPAGIIKTGEWTVAKSFSALAKAEPGFFTHIASSTVLDIEGKLGTDYGEKLVSRLKFWKSPTGTSFDESTLQFSNDKYLMKHFGDHAKEWGDELMTQEMYLKRAQDFIASNAKDNVFVHTSAEGYFFKYDRSLNEFAIMTPENIIMTYFKPNLKLEYFLKQVKKFP